MSMIHLDGCPNVRSETFGARSPGGDELIVQRCIDCGSDEISKGKAAAQPKGKAAAQPKGKAEAPSTGAER